jgi:cell division protein FtsN
VAGIAHASDYPDIIMVVIVATVVIAAIGIPIFARKAPPEEAPKLELKPLKPPGEEESREE